MLNRTSAIFIRRWSLCLALLAMAALNAERIAAAERLNVVLILADDLGWTDLGCYGSDFYESPRIDRLAREGMRFTQNYSACTVCSPTRAALLTGKYPARLHITDWIPGLMPDNPMLLVPDWTKYLPHDETTLAELFRAAGYATGSIGKWHLGTEPYYPETQGFDVNMAGTDKPQPPRYIAPWNIPTLSEGKKGDYLTDRLGEEAVRFIDSHRDEPFFLYLPHFAVHTPIQGRPDLVQEYKAKLRPGLRHTNVAYAAMIESLDAAVGRVLDALDRWDLTRRTVVIFTSDNGGRITQGTTTNVPLRYGKASAYEGGVRVPLVIRWPGVTAAGRECDVPVITMDLYRTLATGCGLPLPKVTPTPSGSPGCDGANLLPLLAGDGELPERDLFWHYPHHQHYQLGGATPYAAIRSGDYKLIEFFNDQHVELYNLTDDLGEEHDLAAALPALADTLRARLHAWRSEIDAQMPTTNPNYDPTRPEYTPPNK